MYDNPLRSKSRRHSHACHLSSSYIASDNTNDRPREYTLDTSHAPSSPDTWVTSFNLPDVGCVGEIGIVMTQDGPASQAHRHPGSADTVKYQPLVLRSFGGSTPSSGGGFAHLILSADNDRHPHPPSSPKSPPPSLSLQLFLPPSPPLQTAQKLGTSRLNPLPGVYWKTDCASIV